VQHALVQHLQCGHRTQHCKTVVQVAQHKAPKHLLVRGIECWEVFAIERYVLLRSMFYWGVFIVEIKYLPSRDVHYWEAFTSERHWVLRSIYYREALSVEKYLLSRGIECWGVCAVERCLLAPVASLDSQSRMTVFSFARIAAVELACHCRGRSALTQPMIPDRTYNHTGELPRCGLKQMNCVSRHL
jgi:hypothetical protein